MRMGTPSFFITHCCTSVSGTGLELSGRQLGISELMPDGEWFRGHPAAGLGLLFCMYLTIIIKSQHQAQGKQLL